MKTHKFVATSYKVPDGLTHWGLFAWGWQVCMPRAVQDAIGLTYAEDEDGYILDEKLRERARAIDHFWSDRFERIVRAEITEHPHLVEEWGDPDVEELFVCGWSENIDAPSMSFTKKELADVIAMAEAVTQMVITTEGGQV